MLPFYSPLFVPENLQWKKRKTQNTGGRKPELDPAAEVADGDFVADNHAALYYVSVDSQGEIRWESGTFRKAGRPDAHVIEILTEHTAPAYRAYLRKRGVSYILAGADRLDSKVAVEKLKYTHLLLQMIRRILSRGFKGSDL